MSNRQKLIAFLFNIQNRCVMDNSKKPSMDKEKEEAPLPLPNPFPMYPFRDDCEDFIAGIGDYILSAEDYVALKDTVGFPPNKSKLKVFLVRKCNIPNPADYSFPDITETLRSYIEENINNTLNEQKQPTRHSPDFRSVHWFGIHYPFTATQAAIVKLLWNAWENGTPDIGHETLLKESGSESKRLVDVFKGHKTYKQLIGQGKTKGSYRLVEPGK